MIVISMKRICVLCAVLSVLSLLGFVARVNPFLPTGISNLNLNIMFALFFVSFFFSFVSLMFDSEIQTSMLARIKELEKNQVSSKTPSEPDLGLGAELLEEVVPEEQETASVT